MWTLEPPALASPPAVVAVGVPEISEKQANKVRQAVAWEALSENTRAAYQKWIARLEAIGVAVDSLTDESLAVVIGQMKDKDGKPLSPATTQPHCGVGQVVSPAYPSRRNGLGRPQTSGSCLSSVIQRIGVPVKLMDCRGLMWTLSHGCRR